MRFIERMPLGVADTRTKETAQKEVIGRLRVICPDLHPVSEQRGNGPARYYASAKLNGCVGLIEAVSHAFCASCNRVRLTSTGLLKPCLCYETGTDLKPLLRGGALAAQGVQRGAGAVVHLAAAQAAIKSEK